MRSAFDIIDAQNRSFLGFNPVAPLWNIAAWRKFFALCVLGSLFAWVYFGLDSTWSQILPITDNLIPLLMGKVSLNELLAESRRYYGVGNHWSAPVIYGTAFIAMSQYLEYIGIHKSENFCLTTCLSLMNIGVFEWLWNGFYAYFQGQTWTITWRWKQVANLFSFTVFIILGIMTLLYLYISGYKLNMSRRTRMFLSFTIIFWATWIFYPLDVGHLKVQTTSGIWENGQRFPQTYYAVDINPTDGVAIGEPFFVENAVIHIINTLTKVFTSGLILSACMVKDIRNE